MLPFKFTLWDVGHGLAIWIQTPFGHNHWIDAGKEGDFSPSWHAANYYRVSALDYLIISHPDNDHINDLHNVVGHIGMPRVLLRNKTLPDAEKFESGQLEHQKVFQSLDSSYNTEIPWEQSPRNPSFNGGVEIQTAMLNWAQSGFDANNSSVVAMYLYAGWLFVMPGDIDETGWTTLWQLHGQRFADLINRSTVRILVAPHHGRKSGYSPLMFDHIKPHLTLISDKKAKEPTCASFRDRPIGLEHEFSGKLRTPTETMVENFLRARSPRSGLLFPPQRTGLLLPPTLTKKFISTKSGGRAQFTIDQTGTCHLHVIEK